MSNEDSERKTENGEPKIIVDSDWKEQVAKEKQSATQQTTDAIEPHGKPEIASPSDVSSLGTNPSDATSQVTGDKPDQATPAAADGSQHLPAPTFEILISMLFTQAISSLGQMPNPIDGKTDIDKPMAKHSIDMLDMLTTKTKGNLSDDESKMLSEALHALRMAYVSVRG